MKAIYQRSWLCLLVAILMVPTVYGQGETILVANFTNGNNAAFNSRIYLWNSSESAGSVTVRVFTLPIAGSLAQELTATPLNLGTLGAKSALNIKLAEDILALLGITLPYTGDGGNLTLEFTIQAANVQGTAQVFTSDFAFGTYPLQEIPSTSAGSPTVLAASFTNGNDTALNSRVYLFNPSASAGSVTVRVFTLPLRGGLAEELTVSPLSLGTLGARAALNVRLAEDVLAPLGITMPYITDGGNLTLEFTIQAADVRGSAQVFTSDFAFGTYPLQQTEGQSLECEEVVFGDPNLEAAVREALLLSAGSPITCELAQSLTFLSAPLRNIQNLSGIEELSSLTGFDLALNSVSNISPLAGLTQLTTVNLSFNSVSNINPLAGLTQLTEVFLDFNSISDISSLAGLTQLTTVNLTSNSISNISPLEGLTQLTTLNLTLNSISDISPLAGLTQLGNLSLQANSISDISPLVANLGIGGLGDSVDLRKNPLGLEDCSDIQALIDRGATVLHDGSCP